MRKQLPFIKYLLEILSRDKLAILIYHRVHEAPDPIFPDEVDQEAFKWQMELISKNFNVLPLSEAINLLRCNRLPSRALSITFDDGYADNVEVALPILKSFDFSATFFIATGFLNGGRMWNDTVIEAIRLMPKGLLDLSDIKLGKYQLETWEDRRDSCQAIIQKIKHMPQGVRQALADSLADRTPYKLPDSLMMTSEQVKILYDSGMEIGGHTASHPVLSTLDEEQAKNEIDKGKMILEEIIGKPIRMFAYPNGKPGDDYLPEHVEIARQAGFDGAVSTVSGVSNVSTDSFQLKRFTPWDKTPNRFLLRLVRNYFV